MALLDTQQLREWWYSREVRERWITGVGGVVGVFVLAYAFIWVPLDDAAMQARNKAHSQISLINWLQHANSRIEALHNAGVTLQGSTTQNILSLIQQTLSQQQLSQYIKQVQQPQTDKVSVQFSNVPFDKMMQWLQPLIKKYSVKINQFQSQKTGQVGIVNAQVILQK